MSRIRSSRSRLTASEHAYADSPAFSTPRCRTIAPLGRRVLWCALVYMAFAALALIPNAAGADLELQGVGATFPYPLYARLFDAYYRETGVRVTYRALGSGAGISRLVERRVDFGGTDAVMHEPDVGLSEGSVLHIPICMGAVVITYNLPGSPQLNVTPDLLADIFAGTITRWNDSRIQAVNNGVLLPGMNIVVVYRSDGSGTTHIFSDYLSKISPSWKSSVGVGTALAWPVGLGAKGNPGVAGLVSRLPGAIGYVEHIYAHANTMPCARVRNRSGVFVEPTMEAVKLALDADVPDTTRIAMTDTGAAQGYPICGFSWIILHREQRYGGRSLQTARALLDMLWWAIHQGQAFAPALHYAPLCASTVRKAEALLKSATYGGRPILQR